MLVEGGVLSENLKVDSFRSCFGVFFVFRSTSDWKKVIF